MRFPRVIVTCLLVLFLCQPLEAMNPFTCAWRLGLYSWRYVSDFFSGGGIYSLNVHRFWIDFDELARKKLFRAQTTIETARELERMLASERWVEREFTIYPPPLRFSVQFVRERLRELVSRINVVANRATDNDRYQFETSSSILKDWKPNVGTLTSPNPIGADEKDIDDFYRKFNQIEYGGLLEEDLCLITVEQLLNHCASYPFRELPQLVASPPKDSTIFLSFVLDEVVMDLRKKIREGGDSTGVFQQAISRIQAFDSLSGGWEPAVMLASAQMREADARQLSADLAQVNVLLTELGTNAFSMEELKADELLSVKQGQQLIARLNKKQKEFRQAHPTFAVTFDTLGEKGWKSLRISIT